MKIDPVVSVLLIIFGILILLISELFQVAVGLALIIIGISMMFRLSGLEMFYRARG